MRQTPLRPDAQRSGKRSLCLCAAALLAAMALLALLNSKITVYSDDYWYGTFFQNGFSGFLREMYQHYMQTNGRLYVHAIIPVVLLFDTKLFIFLSPVLLAALYAMGAKALNAELKFSSVLLAAALGILCTLACDVRYLRMSLLWISAYFNYIFPVCMTAAAALFQQRWYAGRQGRTGHVFGLIFAVLAGASTEQCGIVSLVVVWGYAILNRIWGGVERKRCWGYPLFVLLGFLTILCAPGSWARVDRGVEGGIFSCLIPSVFVRRFYDAIIYAVKYPSAVALLALTDVTAGLLCCRDRRLSRWLLVGFPLAALQILAYVLGWSGFACVLYAVSLLALAVLFLLRREYWMTGVMLLGSLASNMMLIITTLNSERMAMIGMVTLILVMLDLLLRLTQTLRRGWACAVLCLLAAVCCAAYVPTLKGYTESKKIVDANLASIARSRETGVAEFNIDIDPRYRFTMPFEGSYFYNNFRNYYHMDPDTKLIFTSDKWKLGWLETADGDVCQFPTLSDATGLYFPFEQAVAAAGGQTIYSWLDHSYDVTFGDAHWHITSEGRISRVNDDGTYALLGSDFVISLPFSETYTLLYARADQLAQYFGLAWTYDAAQSRYQVRVG